jgi:hypothetical protein
VRVPFTTAALSWIARAGARWRDGGGIASGKFIADRAARPAKGTTHAAAIGWSTFRFHALAPTRLRPRACTHALAPTRLHPRAVRSIVLLNLDRVSNSADAPTMEITPLLVRRAAVTGSATMSATSL